MYLRANNLLPDLQSGFGAHHSTEKAILKVMSDILLALDSGNLAVLTLLDLSAAYDSVDHTTILHWLQKSYGVCGTVLSWFTSYLTGRLQYVRTMASSSVPSAVFYSVPQDSVLGPILFVLYTADLLTLIQSHGRTPHTYAVDTQIMGICQPSEKDVMQLQLSACLDDVSAWMVANRLQLNQNKTEVLWCSSACRQYQIPTNSVQVGSTSVQPVSTVKNLGVHVDADVRMHTHITAVVRARFATQRQLRGVQQCLLRSAVVSMIRALVLSKMDYCNSVLAGAPESLLRHLQSIMNSAAKLIFQVGKYQHVTPLLHELHWLKVPERITGKFRLCVLTYRCLNGTAPQYLTEMTNPVSNRDSLYRYCLRSSDSTTLIIPTTRRSTLGDRSFPAAAATAWNSLPARLRNATPL